MNERNTWMNFDDGNVVPLVDSFTLPDHVLFLMPYMLGTLQDVLDNEGRIQECRALGIWGDIVKGVHHIHTHGYSHRDLKPSNLLVNKQGVLMIGDFGLTRQTDEFAATFCGTPLYAAPEQFGPEPYDGKAADIFAMGCILSEMMTGCIPYPKKFHDIAAHTPLSEIHLDPTALEAAGVGAPIIHLISKCSSFSPENRPTVEELYALYHF